MAGGSPPLSTSRHSRPVGRGCLFRSASGALLCQPWESESINISLEYGNQSTVAPWSVFIFLFLSFYYYYFHFVVSGRRRPFPGVAVRFSAPLGTTAGQLSARLITRNNGRRAGMEWNKKVDRIHRRRRKKKIIHLDLGGYWTPIIDRRTVYDHHIRSTGPFTSLPVGSLSPIQPLQYHTFSAITCASHHMFLFCFSLSHFLSISFLFSFLFFFYSFVYLFSLLFCSFVVYGILSTERDIGLGRSSTATGVRWTATGDRRPSSVVGGGGSYSNKSAWSWWLLNL